MTLTTTPASTAPANVRSLHQTPLGPMVSIWSDQGLYSLQWEAPVGTKHNDMRSRMLDDFISEYFQTGSADFSSVELDSRGWTPFHHEVYLRCREIVPGTTVTYKELARRAGNPDASRAVGAAMSRNRILLVIPCHRVVSAGGGLRGFSAPGGLQTKQFLLDLETA
ncbi:MAG: methylated-DNA--[protein]-cysteine S-methyltransferase [Planctomycetales bacterium]|nr:methylated-DNA--[protein]-cysteine S-methyltransferase [Planctomycetales bacterium]